MIAERQLKRPPEEHNSSRMAGDVKAETGVLAKPRITMGAHWVARGRRASPMRDEL